MQVGSEREAFVPTHDFAPGSAFPALRAGRAAMRVLLEAWIEAAIDCLDALDGDPDLEDGADGEPSLGATEARWSLADMAGWGAEPTDRARDLGGLDQSVWGFGDCSDREEADDSDCE